MLTELDLLVIPTSIKIYWKNWMARYFSWILDQDPSFLKTGPSFENLKYSFPVFFANTKEIRAAHGQKDV